MSELFDNVTYEDRPEDEQVSRIDLEPYISWLKNLGDKVGVIPDVPTGDMYETKVGKRTVMRGRNEAMLQRRLQAAAAEINKSARVTYTHLADEKTRMRVWLEERRVQTEEEKAKRMATRAANIAKKEAAKQAAQQAQQQPQPQPQPQAQQRPAQ